jgi:3-hydroxyisobutyrate dehydrogenase
MSLSVGIVGLGAMGGAFSRRLLSAGWEVGGVDADRDRVEAQVAAGMRSADSLEDLARMFEIIIVSVPNGDILVEVATELAELRGRASLVVDTSTVDPEASAAARRTLELAGVEFLCAPVSGSSGLAASGDLTAFCSGSDRAYERAAPLLSTIARSHELVGHREEARIAKLIVNLVVIGTMELLAESVSLAERFGLSRRAAIGHLQRSVIDSAFLSYKASAIIEGDYEPTASVNLVRKDLALIGRLGSDKGLQLNAVGAIKAEFDRCAEMGYAEQDMAAVVEATATAEL